MYEIQKRYGSWLCPLGSWLHASKRCPRHANAVWEVGRAAWEVCCTPANWEASQKPNGIQPWGWMTTFF